MNDLISTLVEEFKLPATQKMPKGTRVFLLMECSELEVEPDHMLVAYGTMANDIASPAPPCLPV